MAAVHALGKYATRPEVFKRLIEIIEYGDIAVREKSVETLGESQVKEAVEPLIRFLGNPFLKMRVQEALIRIGDRKGILAIKRFKIRGNLSGKSIRRDPSRHCCANASPSDNQHPTWRACLISSVGPAVPLPP